MRKLCWRVCFMTALYHVTSNGWKNMNDVSPECYLTTLSVTEFT
jgi:hypothetical protein